MLKLRSTSRKEWPLTWAFLRQGVRFNGSSIDSTKLLSVSRFEPDFLTRCFPHQIQLTFGRRTRRANLYSYQ